MSSAPFSPVGTNQPATTVPLTVAKLLHDAEQFSYLRRRGVLAAQFDQLGRRYRQLAQQLQMGQQGGDLAWSAADAALISSHYGRNNHRNEAATVAQPFSGTWRGADVEAAYLAQPPGVVVIDDFLSAPALHALRRFCLESTVWNSVRYSHGRLGALYGQGFRCPLLDQIAAALPGALPQLIGARHRLTQLWGYKYPAIMPGDDVHADFAAININLWITPDEANLSPSTGGMVIYDVEAPVDWDFVSYNRRPQRIRQYLADVGAQARYIAYRQNRAVIFNSDLFHGTAACHFRDNYESRRINVTMLYGDRQHDAFRAPPLLVRVPAHLPAPVPAPVRGTVNAPPPTAQAAQAAQTDDTSAAGDSMHAPWRSAALRRGRW